MWQLLNQTLCFGVPAWPFCNEKSDGVGPRPPGSALAKCIEQCVQSEINRTEKAIQLHTLQKVNTRLGTQIPSEIGRRIADYI